MKLFRFLFWSMVTAVIVVLSAIGFLFTLVQPAFASEWGERTCVLVANDAGTLHDFKTGGTPWAEAEPQVMMALDAALKNSDSYVKDAVDVQRSYFIAKMVWEHEMTRDMAVEATFVICMTKWQGVEI